MVTEKRPKRGREFIIFVSICALVLIATSVTVGFWSAARMQDQVIDQFNDEQLVIARSVSKLIERELGFLKNELLLMKGNLSRDALSIDEQNRMIQNSLLRVVEKGVYRIEITDVEGRIIQSFMLDKDSSLKESRDSIDDDPMSGQKRISNEVYISQPEIKPNEMTITLTVFFNETSSRLMSFKLNLSRFLKPLLEDIHSGKSGYAWLIDEKGIFLFHPESDFVGKNAYEIRTRRNPSISYSKINFIQKEKMLKGREGKGYYFSGWHRGETGKIKKLISFYPYLSCIKNITKL